MNIGLGQIILILFVCFLLFGDIDKVSFNVNSFFQKCKQFLNSSK